MRENDVPIIAFREVPIKDIEKLIKDYVKGHGAFWPDEFADDHKLGIMDVFSAIDNLVKEGFLEGKDSKDVPRRGNAKNGKMGV